MEKQIETGVVVQPPLASLFLSFVSIGMMSFGGGLSAWTRREVVQKQGWLDDTQFLAGYSLSQLVPGATNVNLAVFIGTLMRGSAGAVACFFGLMTLPLVIVIALGLLYLHSQTSAGGGQTAISLALGGMGAVAIGLNLGTAVRLARRNLSGLIPIGITVTVAISIGIFRFSLLHVLMVMMPISLLAAWLTRPQ